MTTHKTGVGSFGGISTLIQRSNGAGPIPQVENLEIGLVGEGGGEIVARTPWEVKMTNELSRRNFLKLSAAVVPLAVAAAPKRGDQVAPESTGESPATGGPVEGLEVALIGIDGVIKAIAPWTGHSEDPATFPMAEKDWGVVDRVAIIHHGEITEIKPLPVAKHVSLDDTCRVTIGMWWTAPPE